MSKKVPSEVYHELSCSQNNSTDQLKVINSTKHLATKGVKKIVMFVGNGRSGSSITGSLMDAHPHDCDYPTRMCHGIFKNLPKLTEAASLKPQGESIQCSLCSIQR